MDLLFNAIDQAEPVKQGADAVALVNELMNKGSWQRHKDMEENLLNYWDDIRTILNLPNTEENLLLKAWLVISVCSRLRVPRC